MGDVRIAAADVRILLGASRRPGGVAWMDP